MEDGGEAVRLLQLSALIGSCISLVLPAAAEQTLKPHWSGLKWRKTSNTAEQRVKSAWTWCVYSATVLRSAQALMLLHLFCTQQTYYSLICYRWTLRGSGGTYTPVFTRCDAAPTFGLQQMFIETVRNDESHSYCRLSQLQSVHMSQESHPALSGSGISGREELSNETRCRSWSSSDTS